MRAIKFKAYDTIQKKWLEPMDKLTICDETDFAWSYLTGSNGNAFIVFNDVAPWIKIVEFTGLKDKSGREIYESDRVKVLPYPLPLPVEFIDGCFGVKTKYGFWPLSDDDHIDSIEIIGNIYDKEEP